MVLALMLACGGGEAAWEASDVALYEAYTIPRVSGTITLVSETDETAVAKAVFWGEPWHEHRLGSVKEDVGAQIDHLGEFRSFDFNAPDLLSWKLVADDSGSAWAPDTICAELAITNSNLEDGVDLGCLE